MNRVRNFYSKAGIVSFVLSFITAITFGFVLVVVDQFNRQQIRTGYEGGLDAPGLAIILGLVSLFSLLSNIAAFGLGVMGAFYGGYGRIFAVMGLAMSAGVLWVGYHQEIICLPPMCFPNDPNNETDLINYSNFLPQTQERARLESHALFVNPGLYPGNS